MKFFSIISILIFSTVAFSENNFKKFDEEIDSYANQDQGFFQNSDEDRQLEELFGKEDIISDPSKVDMNEAKGEDKTVYKLPNYVKVSRVISTKIVKPKKKEVLEKIKISKNTTLEELSKKYRTTVNKLKKINHSKTNSVVAGQTLTVPVMKKSGKYAKVIKIRHFINPVQNGRITSRFGSRKDPFNNYKKNYHSGLDLSAGLGSPILAAADGVVEFTGRNGGYGNTIIIRHKNGYKTIYAHCASIVVSPGDSVKMGKVIAAVGRTGTATGAHLHFEVQYKGRLINPEKALRMYELVVNKIFSGTAKS